MKFFAKNLVKSGHLLRGEENRSGTEQLKEGEMRKGRQA